MMADLYLLPGCELRNLTSSRYYTEFDLVRRSLEVCNTVNSGSRLTKASLLTAFQEVTSGNHTLILYVAAQNSGLLIQRQDK